MASAQVSASHTIRVLRQEDLMWRLEGAEQQTLVGLWAATEHLTVGQIELLPGQHSEPHCHGGDESLYLLEGTLHVRVPENGGQRWFELSPRDGFYIPASVSHQYYNVSKDPVRFMFAVAPRYSPEG